jgi:AmmeMemoRadiSam system protein A
VASADLSHYLPYQQAVARDKETIQSILNLDDKPLLSDSNRACGRYPVAVVLYLARHFKWQPYLLHYSNSGDTAGDRDTVVGYAAIAFYGEQTMTTTPTQLTAEQGQVLLRLARETLNQKFGRKASSEDGDALKARRDDSVLRESSGVFVTLKIDNNLRGCIGTLSGHEPLIQGVRTYALHAAFDDPRFRPLTSKELDRVIIEVSVLTPPQPLSYNDPEDLIAKLRPQVDGVTIRKGIASATFLPQVWEQLPTPKDFLTHLCLKAGLAADAWREDRLEVETYQVQYFEESH